MTWKRAFLAATIIVALALVVPGAVLADTEATMAFTGAAADTDSVYVQIRGFNGTTVIATNPGIEVLLGQTAASVEAALIANWVDGDIELRADLGNVQIIDHLNRNFRCYVAENFPAGPWSEVGPGSSPVLNGITYSSVEDPHAIPTLSEWGMIALMTLLLGTGLLVLRRRKTGVSAA